MKQHIHTIIAMGVLLMHTSSCSVLTGFDDKGGAAKQPQGSSYIELKDGTIINGTVLRLPHPAEMDFSKFEPLKRQSRDHESFWMDDREVDRNTIYGYQDKGQYYILFKDQPAKRLRKGRINLYVFEQKSDNMAGGAIRSENRYVFEKQRGRLMQIFETLEYFYETIADNTAAAALCKSLFPYLTFNNMNTTIEKLLQVVDAYNK